MREALIGTAANSFRTEKYVVLKLNISPEFDAGLDNLGEDLGVPKGEAILKDL